MIVAFSLRVRILGEGLMNLSPHARVCFLFFFKVEIAGGY